MGSIIEVKNLSKSYTISHEGREGYSALRDVVAQKAKKIFSFPGWNSNTAVTKEEFWALKDISFEIEQGDRVGIVGRNGAGKSTLLKILSRITEPTSGNIKLKGRVASLLEVGTGFHPELTGKENIFLNGAILGMSRSEIKKHFDAIVDFAEVEKFLDTPVKRYSSGMYVRLAFAVAAHLEPEILVVDEVLAVGDAEFQKKCLGKMEDVSKNDGRTILFVSHNLAALQTICKNGLLLSNGKLVRNSSIGDVIQEYSKSFNLYSDADKQIKGKGIHSSLLEIKMLDKFSKPTKLYVPGDSMNLEILVETDGTKGLGWDIFLWDTTNQVKIGLFALYQIHGESLPVVKGVYKYTVKIAPLFLASGKYAFDFTTSINNVKWDHFNERVFEFEVSHCTPKGMPWDYKSSYGYGSIALVADSLNHVQVQ